MPKKIFRDVEEFKNNDLRKQNVELNVEMIELAEAIRTYYGQKLGRVPSRAVIVRTALIHLSRQITGESKK